MGQAGETRKRRGSGRAPLTDPDGPPGPPLLSSGASAIGDAGRRGGLLRGGPRFPREHGGRGEEKKMLARRCSPGDAAALGDTRPPSPDDWGCGAAPRPAGVQDAGSTLTEEELLQAGDRTIGGCMQLQRPSDCLSSPRSPRLVATGPVHPPACHATGPPPLPSRVWGFCKRPLSLGLRGPRYCALSFASLPLCRPLLAFGVLFRAPAWVSCLPAIRHPSPLDFVSENE